jgi:hypothetical protein
MNRNITWITVLFLGSFAWLVSCKHEIPGSNGGTQPPPGSTPPPTGTTCSPDTVYFQQRVLPVFTTYCTYSGCHNDGDRADGFALTSYNGITGGGRIRAFNLGGSKIWEVINENDPGAVMPPPGRPRLPDSLKNLISRWIMQGARNNSCQSSCDSTDVRYSTTVRTIIDANCRTCHSGTSPVGHHDLTQFAVLRARALDGTLVAAITHTGPRPMPPTLSAKLNDCDIAKIRKWVVAGAPQN